MRLNGANGSGSERNMIWDVTRDGNEMATEKALDNLGWREMHDRTARRDGVEIPAGAERGGRTKCKMNGANMIRDGWDELKRGRRIKDKTHD